MLNVQYRVEIEIVPIAGRHPKSLKPSCYGYCSSWGGQFNDAESADRVVGVSTAGRQARHGIR